MNLVEAATPVRFVREVVAGGVRFERGHETEAKLLPRGVLPKDGDVTIFHESKYWNVEEWRPRGYCLVRTMVPWMHEVDVPRSALKLNWSRRR